MQHKQSVRVMVFCLVAAFLFVGSAPAVRAEAWGTNAAAAILKEVLERTQRAIDGVLLASLKTAATSVLNNQVASLVGGGGLEEAGFVTDWEQYLYGEPLEETRVYMDSYLTAVTGGRGSSNYQSAGTTGSSYGSYLKEYATGMLVSTSDGRIVAATAEEQIPNFREEIASGSIEAINVYFQDNNNPFIVLMNAQEVERGTLARLQDIQARKAESYDGFKGVTAADGKTIITPGSTVKDVVSGVELASLDTLTSSSNPSELSNNVVLSFMNRTLTRLFREGLGSVRSNIEQELSSVTQPIENHLRGLTGAAGTLEQFTTEAGQRLPGSAADALDALPIAI